MRVASSVRMQGLVAADLVATATKMTKRNSSSGTQGGANLMAVPRQRIIMEDAQNSVIVGAQVPNTVLSKLEGVQFLALLDVRRHAAGLADAARYTRVPSDSVGRPTTPNARVKGGGGVVQYAQEP